MGWCQLGYFSQDPADGLGAAGDREELQCLLLAVLSGKDICLSYKP